MKSAEQKAKKVPTIRFAGFEDEWVEKKLGDVANSFGYGLNAAAKPYDGINKYLRITDIDDLSREFKKDDLTTPDFDLVKASDYRLDEGDLLFARTGASVGKTFIYKKNDGLVYFAGFLIRTKIKSEYDSKFIFQNTLTNSYDKFVKITSQRSGQPGINAQEYADYSLLMPKLNEQQKIGSFFSNIDSLISLEQKKYDKLTQVKKSMLEKMFPKEGATVPEIRFAGFSGVWVWKELDDIIVRIATGLNPRDNFKLNSGGSNYYVTIKNFEHGHLYLDEKCDRIDDCALQLIQARSDLQKDDLLFSSIGRIGDCYLIKNNPQNWNINESVFTLRPNKAIAASNYLFHVVHCDIVLSQILDSVTGSTFKSIKIGDLKKALIPIPCKEEQIQIANYLDNLDSLISLQQRKLDKLKNIKKSLLEKMFV